MTMTLKRSQNIVKTVTFLRCSKPKKDVVVIRLRVVPFRSERFDRKKNRGEKSLGVCTFFSRGFFASSSTD